MKLNFSAAEVIEQFGPSIMSGLTIIVGIVSKGASRFTSNWN
jgi:hypothetical protein